MLKCGECHYCVKEHEIDSDGNVLINWRCNRRYFNLYYQVNYGEVYFAKMQKAWYEGSIYLTEWLLPEGKTPDQVSRIQVFFEKKLKYCPHFLPIAKPLTEFKI